MKMQKRSSMILSSCVGALFCMVMASTVYAGCANNSCGYSRSTQHNCYKGGHCEQQMTDSCHCTDPACDSYNPCVDRARCCKTFGNVGAIKPMAPN